jgi:hypothetical protein
VEAVIFFLFGLRAPREGCWLLVLHCDCATMSTHDGAMMSLLRKHSELQTAMDKCRADTRRAQNELQRLQSSTESLREMQQQERTATKREQQRLEELRMYLSGDGIVSSEEKQVTMTVQMQLDQAEVRHAAAVASHHQAEQASLRWKAYKQDQIQLAIESSRKFRMQCQQEQVQVALIEPALIAVAASCANPVTSARVEENERDESDPTTWSLADNDFELSDIVADYRAHRRARDDAALKLDDWKSRHAIATTEHDNRLERARQLEEQLARIHSDCNELQSKTAGVRHLIQDDQALATTYRTSEFSVTFSSFCLLENTLSSFSLLSLFAGMEQRRSGISSTATGARRVSLETEETRHLRRAMTVPSIIPPLRDNTPLGASTENSSRVAVPLATRNPYATKRRLQSGGVQSRPAVTDAEENDTAEKRARRDELVSIVLGPSTLSARRSRRDRQFGCSLEISNVPSDSMEEVTMPHSPNSEPLTNLPASAVDVGDVDNNEVDDLLNFVAFSKRA